MFRGHILKFKFKKIIKKNHSTEKRKSEKGAEEKSWTRRNEFCFNL